jgi:hypothetical protein
MTRDSRLALSEHLADLTDRQLGACEQREQTQPRWFGDRSER